VAKRALAAQELEFNMQIYMSLTVGQEVNGVNVMVKVEKASTNKALIEKFISGKQNPWTESHPLNGANLMFFMERHLQEIEVDTNE
jgi:hypothetical protein